MHLDSSSSRSESESTRSSSKSSPVATPDAYGERTHSTVTFPCLNTVEEAPFISESFPLVMRSNAACSRETSPVSAAAVASAASRPA